MQLIRRQPLFERRKPNSDSDFRFHGTIWVPLAYSKTGPKMLTFLLWCALFLFSWPLALAALILYPIVWLILLPFRILGIAVHGVLELVSAIIFLPVKALRAI
jgi:hypothetical protein